MVTRIDKTLRRQDVFFEEKDQALRDDVRTLGAMVGDLIREQNGEELFELVENARLRAIRRREGNEMPGEELEGAEHSGDNLSEEEKKERGMDSLASLKALLSN